MAFLFCSSAPSVKRYGKRGPLTLDVEMKDVALGVALAVQRRAPVPSGAVASYSLQHETLVRYDHAGRYVVAQFLVLIQQTERR